MNKVKLTKHHGNNISDFDSHFCYFLKQFENEDSPIGDLARDYKRDCQLHRLPYADEYRRVPDLNLAYLQDSHACHRAIEAYQDAIKMFAYYLADNNLIGIEDEIVIVKWGELNGVDLHEKPYSRD